MFEKAYVTVSYFLLRVAKSLYTETYLQAFQSQKSPVQGYFNTPLEHTPKPLPTGYKGI